MNQDTVCIHCHHESKTLFGGWLIARRYRSKNGGAMWLQKDPDGTMEWYGCTQQCNDSLEATYQMYLKDNREMEEAIENMLKGDK